MISESDVRALLARHLPRYDARTVERLGAGLDHAAWCVDDDLIVRFSLATDAEVRCAETRREADLLSALPAWSTLPVPTVRFVDEAAGVLAYTRLAGVSLLDRPPADLTSVAAALGRFLGRLHQAPEDVFAGLVPRDDTPLTEWLGEAEEVYREIVGQIPNGARQLIQAFLARPTPSEPTVLAFCHNDLGAEHILVDPERCTVTGILDLTDAAIADPAIDLGRLYRDLGPETFEMVIAHYGRALAVGERARAIFYARCTLIEDLAYGLRTGNRRYSDAAFAGLGRTFG